jgi:hypothetical protein
MGFDAAIHSNVVYDLRTDAVMHVTAGLLYEAENEWFQG